jgi:hypothetical protein
MAMSFGCLQARKTVNVVHELGHAFASLWHLNKGEEYGSDGPYVNIPAKYLFEDGFVQLPPPNEKTWRQHPGIRVQMRYLPVCSWGGLLVFGILVSRWGLPGMNL